MAELDTELEIGEQYNDRCLVPSSTAS